MLNSVEFPEFYKARRKNVFLLDTDILSDIAKDEKSKVIRDKIIASEGKTLFCVPSVLELGFGLAENIDINETKLLDDLYRNTLFHETTSKGGIYIEHGKVVNEYRNDWIPIVPDIHNWFGAKKTMISYMEDKGVKPKNAKKLQFDIMISHAAWNSNAIVWTNNIKDHVLANYYMRYYECTRNRDKKSDEAKNCIAKYMPPIFDTEMLEKAFNGDAFNVYDELAKKTKNQDVKEILEISKKM